MEVHIVRWLDYEDQIPVGVYVSKAVAQAWIDGERDPSRHDIVTMELDETGGAVSAVGGGGLCQCDSGVCERKPIYGRLCLKCVEMGCSAGTWFAQGGLCLLEA